MPNLKAHPDLVDQIVASQSYSQNWHTWVSLHSTPLEAIFQHLHWLKCHTGLQTRGIFVTIWFQDRQTQQNYA